MRFDPLDEEEKKDLEKLERQGMLPCYHYDADMPLRLGSRLPDTSTPLVDILLRHQDWDEDVLESFYAMMGRLRFRVGDLDKWQVMPLLGRGSGTGKSTISNLICEALFRQDAKATLPATPQMKERDFGRLQLGDIVLESEVGRTTCPSSTNFKKMVAAEAVTMQFKDRGEKISKEFTTPLLWATNDVLDFQNTTNTLQDEEALARRIVFFPFTKTLTDEVQALASKSDIRAKELPSLAARCVSAYIQKIKRLGSHNSSSTKFWDSLPQLLLQGKNNRVAIRSDCHIAVPNSEGGLSLEGAATQFFIITGEERLIHDVDTDKSLTDLLLVCLLQMI